MGMAAHALLLPHPFQEGFGQRAPSSLATQ